MIDVLTELREQRRVQRQPDGSPTYLSDLAGRAADEIERIRGIIRAIASRCDAVKADCEAGAPVSAYNVASGILGQIGSDTKEPSK